MAKFFFTKYMFIPITKYFHSQNYVYLQNYVHSQNLYTICKISTDYRLDFTLHVLSMYPVS